MLDGNAVSFSAEMTLFSLEIVVSEMNYENLFS